MDKAWPISSFDGKENWGWNWWNEELPNTHGPEVGALEVLLPCLREAAVVSFDTETSGLDMTADRIVAMSFAWQDPMDGTEHASTIMCDDGTDWTGPTMQPLVDWLEDEDQLKDLANAKFDMNILAFHGIKLRGVRCDTMLLSQLVDQHEQTHNVDDMTKRELGLTKIPTATLIGKGKKFTGWGPVPRGVMAEYANEDVIAVLRLAPIMLAKAAGKEMMETVRLEMDLLPYVAEMEQVGMLIDVPKMRAINQDFQLRVEAAETEARGRACIARDKLAKKKRAFYEKVDAMWLKAKAEDAAAKGKKVGKAPLKLSAIRNKAKTTMRKAEDQLNLGSGPQLQELIYGEWELHRKLGMRNPPQTKKNNPDTSKDTLEKFAPYSEFVQELLRWRVVQKLVSTYTGVLPDLVRERTGRVHASYWQCGTGTGRFACSEPNLQNIPNHSEEGRLLRTCFIPAPGKVLLAPDYSQIELRVTAHMSGEEAWIEAFGAGVDIHQATADLLGCTRVVAKVINFSIMYGAGPTRVSATAGISVDEARDVIDNYWATLSKVRAFLDRGIQHARDHGYVKTLYGRRRPIPNIKHKWSGPRRGAENQAGNHPVQGTAADIIKMAMIAVGEHVLPRYDGLVMMGSIHDELLFEAPIEQATEIGRELKVVMENVVKLDVPLVVDLTQGADWAEAH